MPHNPADHSPVAGATAPADRVLILGEGAANVRRSAEWWEANGYRVSMVDFDREGLHLANLKSFDLVFLDMSLPARDQRFHRIIITGTNLGIPVLPHG